MIRLYNVNKYFNKGKQNEIHVINDTTLQFGKSGLTTILGASGSGKTTLLNVIGGLDKAVGTIDFDDKILHNYHSNEWDQIRNEKIGFIFQNYHLLETITVFENIKLSLTMLGISDKDEINHKIEYVLNAVGMYRYRNKRASDLSGGQKQRVAIARALVKNPEVIIADEPTGNLDTNNSIEVLKIIKEISKEKLVILVTHNKSLAYNFSDRIINIVDGRVVSDELNSANTNNLDFVDNNIYLKDLNSFSNNNINVYSDEPIDDLELTIVKINNNYYLQTKSNNITVENINKSKKVLVNKHKIESEKTFLTETNYNSQELEKYQTSRKHIGIYTFKDSLIMAFRKLSNLGRRAKLQIFALIMLGIMFTTSALLLLSAITIDTSKIYVDDNLYYIGGEDVKLIGNQIFDDEYNIYLGNYSSSLFLNKASFTQSVNIKILPVSLLGQTLPMGEAIIDESVLDKDFDYNYQFNSFGITKKEHLIGEELSFQLSYNLKSEKVKIVDTVNNNSKSVYVNDKYIDYISISYFSYTPKDIVELNITQTFDYDENSDKIFVYVHENYSNENANEIVIGTFNNVEYEWMVFVDNNQKDKIIKQGIEYSWRLELFIYNKNGGPMIDSEYIINVRDREINQLEQIKGTTTISSLSQLLIALGISAVIFYFLVRSSLSSRVKEISVLRALGVKKREVRKLFVLEYVVITTFSSLIGVIIGNIITNAIAGSFLGSYLNLRTNFSFTLITIIAIYVVNIVIAMLPVNKLLRKTPSEMLTIYDI